MTARIRINVQRRNREKKNKKQQTNSIEQHIDIQYTAQRSLLFTESDIREASARRVRYIQKNKNVLNVYQALIQNPRKICH